MSAELTRENEIISELTREIKRDLLFEKGKYANTKIPTLPDYREIEELEKLQFKMIKNPSEFNNSTKEKKNIQGLREYCLNGAFEECKVYEGSSRGFVIYLKLQDIEDYMFARELKRSRKLVGMNSDLKIIANRFDLKKIKFGKNVYLSKREVSQCKEILCRYNDRGQTKQHVDKVKVQFDEKINEQNKFLSESLNELGQGNKSIEYRLSIIEETLSAVNQSLARLWQEWSNTGGVDAAREV